MPSEEALFRWSSIYWVTVLGLLSACGSRVEQTATTNGECKGDCDEDTASVESVGDSSSMSSASERSGAPPNSTAPVANPPFASLPDGSESTVADGAWDGGSDGNNGGCRVAYVDYPVGALVPADGCGASSCTCDVSGELTDCSDPSMPCAFDGNGPIRPCPEELPLVTPSDPFSIEEGYILGDTLVLELSHEGGCARHDYAVCFRKGPETVQPYDVVVLHDAHDDRCDDVTQTTLRFDLTPMAQDSMARFGADGGIITTRFGVYTFGELPCVERDEAARIAVTRLVNDLDRSCKVDEDCVSTRFTEECTEECNAVSRVDEVYRFDRLRETLQAGACAQFLDDGCTPQVPLCERRSAVCVDRVCELAPP